jgi:hypothetical protein
MTYSSWICSCFQDPSTESPKILTETKDQEDLQTPVLNNVRNVFTLLSNIGAGGVNVPGLQAAGQIEIQIIDLVKVWS